VDAKETIEVLEHFSYATFFQESGRIPFVGEPWLHFGMMTLQSSPLSVRGFIRQIINKLIKRRGKREAFLEKRSPALKTLELAGFK
jgi:hypothetical protein